MSTLTLTELEPRDCPAPLTPSLAPLPDAAWASAPLVEVSAPDIIPVVPDATYPPDDTANVRRNLDVLPARVAAFLAGVGYAVRVYADGRHLPDLPRYADLKGVPIPGEPPGGRTWDTITAATSDVTFLTPADAARVQREAGIALHSRLTPAELAGSPGDVEQFAEAFGRYVISGRDLTGYFQALFAARGWA